MYAVTKTCAMLSITPYKNALEVKIAKDGDTKWGPSGDVLEYSAKKNVA